MPPIFASNSAAHGARKWRQLLALLVVCVASVLHCFLLDCSSHALGAAGLRAGLYCVLCDLSGGRRGTPKYPATNFSLLAAHKLGEQRVERA